MLPSGFGLCIPWQNAENDSSFYNRTLSEFKPDCWYNHKFDQSDPKYTPMLYKASAAAQVATALSMASSTFWMLGNEPEVTTQSNDSPEQFAKGVKEWASSIGSPFAIPGILWSNNGRMWWEEYQNYSAPEPAAYHIHIYAYDVNDWTNQLYEAKRVFDDKPLIVSEYGGWQSDPAGQEQIMHAALHFIRSGLLSAAFWFSAHYGTWSPMWEVTDALDSAGVTTDVGKAYKRVIGTTRIFLPTVSNGHY